MSGNLKRVIPILLMQFFAVVIVVTILVLVNIFGGQQSEKVKEQYIDYFGEYTEPATANKSIVNMNISEKYTITGNSFTIPLKGKITSPFGERNDPFTDKKANHYGTDIAGDKGENIVAAAGGKVEKVGFDKNGYGNYLKISHGNGITTLYAHCSKILVEKGEEVVAGQNIALVGSTGKSTGNHLHFEIRINNVAVNSMYYIDW